MPPYFQLVSLATGLIIAGLIVAFALQVAWGGFKVGRLRRHFELTLKEEQLPVFVQRMNARLVELGFRQQGTDAYVQDGQSLNPASHTHAKSPKVLEFRTEECNLQVKVILTVRYKHVVIADSGEGAYADAVLKYVTNESDSMGLVANISLLAFLGLFFSVWAWLALAGLKAFHVEPLVDTIRTIAITSFWTSVIAIVCIVLRPAELRGLGLAVAGILISIAMFAALRVMG